jgi:hypothetical protein
MNEYRFHSKIRQLIQDALPADTSLFGKVPEVKYIYLPAGHARALNPDSMLVVGIRGAGKSFWWGALQIEGYRTLIGKSKTQAGIDKTTIVSQGFGEKSSIENYPGKDVLVNLLKVFDARLIWRTIILRQLTRELTNHPLQKNRTWNERVKWVKGNPEMVERQLYEIDNRLEAAATYHLVLFDALDRTADDWKSMYALVRGLLQVLLECRSYKRIRPKAFVRPDHLEDSSVAAFPDSSKVLSQKVELSWPRNELYGLLWQYLANASGSRNIFRDGCRGFEIEWKQQDQVWTVPEQLRNDESKQREVFHAITGPFMGRERRRGFPYTWLPNHLGDARRLVSPRSILAALRHAAGDASRQNYKYAIHYESIKTGVQEASKIRGQEMLEDYPWVDTLMKPLSGLSVPCSFEDINGRWDHSKSLEKLKKDIQSAVVKLPPSRIDAGPDGVREDLESLGLFQRMADGRVNLPDVYRVGYGIGRRGGVRAVYRG